MSKPLGQAARSTGRQVHRFLQIALALVILLTASAGVLAWRLAQGPIELGWLARRIEAAANPEGSPIRVSLDSAGLAWEGFSQGVDMPLDIRLTGIVATDAAGNRVAEVPEADVSLSAASLLAGRIVPRALDIEGIRLRARRSEDGSVAVDLGPSGEAGQTGAGEAGRAGDAASGDAPPATQPQDSRARGQDFVADLVRDLARPATSDAGVLGSRWSQLRRVRVRDAALTVEDRQLGTTWRASEVMLDIRRRPEGGAIGKAELALGLGDQVVRASAEAILQAGSQTTTVALQLSPVNPARLAKLAPALAPLAALDATVTLGGTAELSDDFAPQRFSLRTRIGAGRIFLGEGSAPLLGATAEFDGTPSQAELRLTRLELAPRPEGPRSVIQASAALRRAHGRLSADITVALDQVAFADLPALWPAGVGGPGTRPWITRNITAGSARNARIALTLMAAEDFSDADVTALSGGLDGEDLTLHWLRPVPPLEHGNARLSFVSRDEIEIAVTSGRQAGGTQGGIAVQSGRVTILGIAGHDQFLSLETDLAGPVPDLLAVLKHPRLRLLDRRPIPIQDAAGTIAGKLTLTRLPLKDDLPVEDIRIQSVGKLTKLHLGGIAAGHDLDRGTLDFEAGTEGLKLRGSATLAEIPTQLQVEMDFRSGPPTQVLQKITVSGNAEARQLAAAGLDSAGLLDGTTGLQATWQTRRNGRGEVSLRADLGRTVLQLPQLNFRKPAGRPATGEAHVLLERDQVTSIDRLRIDGEGVLLAGRVGFAGGRAQRLQFDRVMLGPATDASGELRIPQAPGEPWVATLSGPSLDASAEFGRDSTSKREKRDDADRPGPPWKVDMRFERVVLGPEGRLMRSVMARAENDGEVIRRGLLEGRTSTNKGFRIEITPQPGGRTLNGSAEDAGGLLRALDVVDDMQGGHMTVTGRYDDSRAGHPLSGTAEIVDFRMRNTPSLAKLLQVMTLYGLVEALQGPGLGFDRLIAPFRLTGDELELTDARVFNASLGMTAKGRIDLARRTAAVEGTIVPAYFFNTLLGKVPLVGRLFSPERGGGLFAATYAVRGKLDDPTVTINALAALTPGFLRGLFGLFDLPNGGGPQN
ncbi:conserved protein of unknown function [Rhodovastum atsumiense]|uniref:DUF3971 domain-containing protein n=1 Tax=Rhodovastum atsumiense TaxID=504468 RepID=A0A5M6J0W8_9PROT|nr:AsmA-like C-terminal region-containing protein [Rhodovastum atsumiense]KAA5613717.1 DUF3971 domain-containing protein [Rhodovastum atsumiense]CAH2599641.1 conserved protein of unknown function [Rhodovastum atsumiense]